MPPYQEVHRLGPVAIEAIAAHLYQKRCLELTLDDDTWADRAAMACAPRRADQSLGVGANVCR
jgi:hypothetical protein